MNQQCYEDESFAGKNRPGLQLSALYKIMVPSRSFRFALQLHGDEGLPEGK